MEAAFDATPARARGTRPSDGAVQESGFGEEAAAAPEKRERGAAGERPRHARSRSSPSPSRSTPTRRARCSIEGDVVLDVIFEATGVLRVFGVAQGLGHGLDEAAIEAAKKIRFNPARRDGAPVDHTAKLRVVFRLA